MSKYMSDHFEVLANHPDQCLGIAATLNPETHSYPMMWLLLGTLSSKKQLKSLKFVQVHKAVSNFLRSFVKAHCKPSISKLFQLGALYSEYLIS